MLERAKNSSSTQNVLAQYLGRIHIDYHDSKKMVSKVLMFPFEQLIDVLFLSICPHAQRTQLVSILYLCYGFSRYAYLLYAFSRYTFLRYAYLRYAFSRYAFLRYAFSRYAFYHSVCLSAF